ncbi:hypothetical protein [Streptomyces violascens]|uniref:hypothetical protein n=1 Tax=Streptomyces violascens TaxID=67381 RepID=UPI00369B9A8F
MADNLDRAVVRAEICAETIAELSERPSLTPAGYNLLAEAQDELAVQRAVLAQAGQLHRIDGGA